MLREEEKPCEEKEKNMLKELRGETEKKTVQKNVRRENKALCDKEKRVKNELGLKQEQEERREKEEGVTLGKTMTGKKEGKKSNSSAEEKNY